MVTLVRDRDLARTIRSIYGSERARRIQRSLEPQCLSGFRKDESFRIVQSDVILVADAGDFVFYDCVYEELLQSLGPINDDATRAVEHVQRRRPVRLLRRLRPVSAQHPLSPAHPARHDAQGGRGVLPEMLPEVRAWVAQMNGLSD